MRRHVTATKTTPASVVALLNAPYGHRVWRDAEGNSHVELTHEHKGVEQTVYASAFTFDEAVFAALDKAAVQFNHPTTRAAG